MAAEVKELRKKERFGEIGKPGLEHWSGRINEEWIKELQYERKWRTLREMRENDPVVGAILFAVEMLIRSVSWPVIPASRSQEDLAAAEFLDSCRTDMSQSWEHTLSEILSFLWCGFSYHEIVYKRRLGDTADPTTRSQFNDGKIGWRKLPIRSQDTLDHWILDDNGGVRAYVQLPPPDYVLRTIPITKSLLFRTTSYKNNPEGRSLLRSAFRPWFFKKRIEEIEGIGIERDLAGLPVIYAPAAIMSSNAGDLDKQIFSELKNIVRNIRRDEQEGVIMPGDRDDKGHLLYELKLLSTGGQRQFDTQAVLLRYDRLIAITVLADFILLGHEKVGSFALSSDKTALFGVALGAFLDEITSVLNKYAIPRLFKANGWFLEKYPHFEHGDIETPDLKELGDYIGKLSGAGMELFPDDLLENRLRNFASLPSKTNQMK